MNALQDMIKNVFDKYRWEKDIEIEFRLGWFDRISKRFTSDINEFHYNEILKQLNSFKDWDHIFSKKTKEYYTKDNIRIIVNEHGRIVKTMMKKKLENFDVFIDGCPYDLRISIDVEKDTVYKGYTWSFLRIKERTSFVYKMWRYDITKIHTPTEFISNPYIENNDSYEFEIEYLANNLEFDNDYLSESIIMKLDDILSIPEKNHLRNVKVIR